MMMDKRYNLCLIFPALKNVDLLKDMGMIPYLLEKNHGFDVKIASYKNAEYYAYLDKEVKGLTLDFIKKSPLSLYLYLLKNYKTIDVLMLVHISTQTIQLALLYKFLKPSGYLYVKGDMSTFDYASWGKRFFLTQLKRVFLYKRFVEKVDLLSYENKKTEKYILDIPADKKMHLPNGFYETLAETYPVKRPSFNDKEKLILFVARHGHYAKNSEILLETLRNIEDTKGWKILFVGDMTDAFEKEKNDFLEANPHHKNSVHFLGNIESKKELFEYYRKSMVLILPSRWEGFPLVALEGLYFGDILLLSNTIFSSYDLRDDEEVGLAFKGDDSDSLKEQLLKLFEDKVDLELEYQKSLKLFDDKFRWEDLVAKLNDKIRSDIL